MLISAIICWFQYFFIIGPENYNLGVKLRSMGLFMEPSYAGLALYSMSVAYITSFLFKTKKISDLFYAIFYFATGFLTLAMHIVTFLLVLIIITYYYLTLNVSYKKIIIILSSLVALIIFINLIYLIEFEFLNIFQNHFNKRINIYNPDNSSLSLLA